MAFDATPHLIKMKGGALYLPVVWRLCWLREQHPDASVEVELIHLDLDQKLAVARATVTLPNGTKATDIGSETERDFPAGWVEKASTKAIGRALAALGFGTQFALELAEGGPAETPVASVASPAKSNGSVSTVEERISRLRAEVSAACMQDKEGAAKLSKAVDDLTLDELEKALAWFKARAARVKKTA